MDDLDSYHDCDSVSRNDDVGNLGNPIQDDDMYCDFCQDEDDDLLCNPRCFSDSNKSVTSNPSMCSHVPTLHDFEEEIIFSSHSDEFESNGDSDIEDVLQMDFELCIPFGSELFPHHGDSIPQDLSTVALASKETYQKQDCYCDETMSTNFSDQVSYLNYTGSIQFFIFISSMSNQFLSSLMTPSLPVRGARCGLY